MRLFGLLILLNTLFVSGYFVFGTSADIKRISGFAAVGAILSLILIISDRVTHIKLDGIGEIAAAAEKAEASAERILEIEQEVETHRDTIALVARDANDTRKQLGSVTDTIHKLQQQMVDIDGLQDNASKALNRLSSLSDFYNDMMSARSDDRQAFERVSSISYDGSDFRNEQARQFLEVLPKEIEVLNILDYQVPWDTLLITPETASFQTLQNAISQLQPIHQSKLIETIWETDRFPKKQRIQFMIDVIANTSSMRCLDKATRLLDNEANVGKNFLGRSLYRQWWETNEQNY